jgi:hypothetical protein
MARPQKYAEGEAPYSLTIRIPRELYEEAKRYVSMRLPMTLSELIIDGLRLRLKTPADPRDIILSDDNTVMHELQEMIQTAVQAEIGRLHTFMGSAVDALTRAPAPESPAEPMPESAYDDNEVEGTAQDALQPTAETPAESTTKQTAIPSYDATKFYLGKLCPAQHDYQGTGQSLLRRHNGYCRECERLSKRAARAAKRQQVTA